MGFPCGSAGKESACNVGDLGLIPGLGRFPWKKERLPTPVFWPGEFHGLYSPWGCEESDMTERLSLFFSAYYKRREFLNSWMEEMHRSKLGEGPGMSCPLPAVPSSPHFPTFTNLEFSEPCPLGVLWEASLPRHS